VGGVFSVVSFAEVAQFLSLWWWVWAVPEMGGVDLGVICDRKMVKNVYFFVFLCKKRALFVIFW